MGRIFQDVRFALRTMRKSPGFAAIAIATLALGIGGTAIMFAVVDAVLLRPLAYPHSGQIVHLSEAYDRHPGMSIAYANFLDWQALNHVFSTMGAVRPHSATLTGLGTAEQLEAWQVSHDFFRTLEVKPALGRDFIAQDDQPSANPTVLLSRNLWQRRFSSDPGVLGSSITLDGRQYTVIGVLPQGFSYNDQTPAAYVPIGLIQDPGFWQSRYDHAGTYAIARMKPGVTLEQARNDLDRVAQMLQQQYPATNSRNFVSVELLREYMVGSVRTPLLILLGAVALLLLIACGNVANLLLARASARKHELAIRQAIGATRGRLLGQLLTESVLLGLMGGAVGALLGFWGTQALVAAAPDSLPRLAEIHIDARVLAFTFAVAVLTGILFGIFPAIQAPRAGVPLALREGERGMSRGQQRVRAALIVGQIALSLALLLGAGLLGRSFQRVMQVDAGFNTHQLLTGTVVLSANKYKTVAQVEQFYREAMRNIRAIPGVTAASAVNPMPMSGNEWDTDYLLEGMKPESMQTFPNSEIGYFGPDYVSTMQIPLIAGRAFTEADNEHSLPVAIVNQEFARKNWPNLNPIGKRIRLGDPKQLTAAESPGSHWRTVVGVIGDVKQYGLDRSSVPTVYTPFSQGGTMPLLRWDLVIRVAVSDPLSLIQAVRKAVSQADPDQAVADFYTMDGRLTARLATRQISMVLLAVFAALALTLGAIGIYGVVAYWVAQRTREIGVRMALGASAPQVLRMILAGAARLLGIGVAVGLVMFLALGRFLQSMLFGVSTGDVRVYVAVLAVLSAVTALASYLPARRAAKIDPMVALRYE